MVSATNYNDWLYSLIEPYIGKKVIEIGTGIGTTLRKIIQGDVQLTTVEPNKKCKEYLSKYFSNNQKFVLTPSTIKDCKGNNDLDENFDTIICINVLEHLIKRLPYNYLLSQAALILKLN
jgi:2-polyprenyl-3-methyl-5-hydroxy-6-metoxy-1,4-benzoquinol methylase